MPCGVQKYDYDVKKSLVLCVFTNECFKWSLLEMIQWKTLQYVCIADAALCWCSSWLSYRLFTVSVDEIFSSSQAAV